MQTIDRTWLQKRASFLALAARGDWRDNGVAAPFVLVIASNDESVRVELDSIDGVEARESTAVMTTILAAAKAGGARALVLVNLVLRVTRTKGEVGVKKFAAATAYWPGGTLATFLPLDGGIAVEHDGDVRAAPRNPYLKETGDESKSINSKCLNCPLASICSKAKQADDNKEGGRSWLN